MQARLQPLDFKQPLQLAADGRGMRRRTFQRALTRAQVAEILGVSVSTVRSYEGKLLFPDVDANGVHRFDPSEVYALAKERGRPIPSTPPKPTRLDGEKVARILELAKEGRSKLDICIEVRVHPDDVEELMEKCRPDLQQARKVQEDARLAKEEADFAAELDLLARGRGMMKEPSEAK